MSRETLIDFPTEFPIKALGKDSPDFEQAVVEIISAHATFDRENDVKVQTSGKGNYLSVTVTLMAENQIQLDAIYQALHDDDLVLMVF